jgi:cell division protein FtsB
MTTHPPTDTETWAALLGLIGTMRILQTQRAAQLNQQAERIQELEATVQHLWTRIEELQDALAMERTY